jgi:hypothetical protein
VGGVEWRFLRLHVPPGRATIRIAGIFVKIYAKLEAIIFSFVKIYAKLEAIIFSHRRPKKWAESMLYPT